MKKSKIKLIVVLAALLLVLMSFASCKNKETNGEGEATGNSSIVIEEIEDDATESLTSEEKEELESAWSEMVSKGDALEIVPVTPSSSEVSSSDVSSTPATSSSTVSSTVSSDAPNDTPDNQPDNEPDNNNTSSSSGNGWYPGDWEL